MKGEIELYNICFLILKVELHFKQNINFYLHFLDVFILKIPTLLYLFFQCFFYLFFQFFSLFSP